MLKRIFSVVLCLLLVFSIAFQCTFISSAIAGVDDAIVIGVCLDLLAFGITVHSVSNFVKSDTFNDFCSSVGSHIDSGISAIKRGGKLFIATTKLAWADICNWVKSKFSGLRETKVIEYDTFFSSDPTSITLKNGTVVPYAEFMEFPFFIYYRGNQYRAYNCTGANAGMAWGTSLIQIWCTGHGTVNYYYLNGGTWVEGFSSNMIYGNNYKGVPGSFYNVDFGSNVNANTENFYQYRTMQRVSSGGTAQEQAPPQQIPDVQEPTVASVTMTSDPTYYPGAVDAAAEVIQEDELVLIQVPDELVVDANTANPSITTDANTIGSTIAELSPIEVRPKVLTNAVSVSGTVDGVIDDTPVAELDGTNAGSAEADIEIANKFRLPKSFLEGFPFSIPYSIYIGIQSFVSDPQAPVFNIPFAIERLGISENMEIDLTNWNPVARLCRALLSLVWVAGLAMACGKFIKR